MRYVAEHSVRDQLRRLGSHPSMLAFFGSSDELPPGDIEALYRQQAEKERWPNPIIAAASQATSPISGPTGVKMSGPYSWVPPIYWLQDTPEVANYLGGAFGFLTEGGPGEAPLTLLSWNRTVPQEHLWDAEGSMSSWWSFHMGNPKGKFHNLFRYTPPLDARYGSSSSAEEFCFKAQMANYEGIRAMFEGYTRNKGINATGVIQWMMNDAWPDNLWHLYDYYLGVGGGYFGALRAGEDLHASLSFVDGSVAVVNNRYFNIDEVQISFTAYNPLTGAKVFQSDVEVANFIPANQIFLMLQAVPFDHIIKVVGNGTYLVSLSWSYRSPYDSKIIIGPLYNWYWLSYQMDVVAWDESNNLWTNCSQWADFSSLQAIDASNISVTYKDTGANNYEVTLANVGASIALFTQLAVVEAGTGREVTPTFYSDNYVTLLPGTAVMVTMQFPERKEPPSWVLKATTYNDVMQKEK